MFPTLSLLAALMAANPHTGRNLERVDCDASRWQNPPQVVDKVFRGTLEMRCRITTATNGDYGKLADTFIRELEEQQQVHMGPTEKTFEGLPGVTYDVTMTINEEGMKWVRSNTFIGTDGESRFVVSSESTKISATGLASNVIKMDNAARVQRDTTPGMHIVDIRTTANVRKPGIIGVATFKNIVIEQMKSQMQKKTPETLQAISDSM